MKNLLLTTALMCSLATAGMAYADAPDNHSDHKHPGFMDDALSKLPAADASMVRDAMKQAHEQDKPLFDKMHTLRQERQSIVSADKFDKDAYLAKSADIQKLEDQMHVSMDQTFASVLGKLPANERKTLADAWANFGEHHHGKGAHDKTSDNGMATPAK